MRMYSEMYQSRLLRMIWEGMEYETAQNTTHPTTAIYSQSFWATEQAFCIVDSALYIHPCESYPRISS